MIIHVLNIEIRRLSGKERPTDNSAHSTAARSQPKTKPNKTRHRAWLISISTQTEDGQNKEDMSTAASEQAHTHENSSFAADHTSSTQENPLNMSMSRNEMKSVDDESSSAVNLPGISHKSICSGKTMLTFTDITKNIEQELQEVAGNINKAGRVIVFVGAGVSTNCGIPVSIHLYLSPSLSNRVTQDFRSKTGLHKTNRGLFDKEVLDDEERRKELYKCLVDIRNISKSEDLVQTDTHRFLQVLQWSGKLQRCYTQNLNGLEVRAGLSADMESEDCEVLQLHGNLDSFRCSYCRHLTSWDDVYETALISGGVVPCPNCASMLEERRTRGKRMNVHVGHLRPNIVLFHDIDDPWSEKKASIIDNDANSRPDVLLVIGTSLAIDGPRYELKNKLIPAIHRNSGKVIYVNNRPPPKAFCKPVVDHIFEMDCDTWVRELAAHEPSLWDNEVMQKPQCLFSGFKFWPQARTVDEVIKEAELKLINIGDYSDIQFRLRTKEEVKEDLSPFLPQRWLSTSPLMCVLSLFGWNESTKVLHSKHTEFDVNDVQKRKKMLGGPVWPIGRNHTRIIIPYNPGNHWILIEVDISARVIRYYNSLPGYNLSVVCKFVEAQIKRVGEQLSQDYSTWNPSIDGVSIFPFLWLY